MKKAGIDSAAPHADAAALTAIDSTHAQLWPCRMQLGFRKAWGEAVILDEDHPLEDLLRYAIAMAAFCLVVLIFLSRGTRKPGEFFVIAPLLPGLSFLALAWMTGSLLDVYWVYDRLSERLVHVLAFGPLRYRLRGSVSKLSGSFPRISGAVEATRMRPQSRFR